jgi:hypothetical protein
MSFGSALDNSTRDEFLPLVGRIMEDMPRRALMSQVFTTRSHPRKHSSVSDLLQVRVSMRKTNTETSINGKNVYKRRLSLGMCNGKMVDVRNGSCRFGLKR